MFENMKDEGIAGAPVNSRGLPLEEISILESEKANFKSGYALMLDSKGLGKVSDGSDFYGVLSESDRTFGLGTGVDTVTRGLRRVGPVYVIPSGDTASIVKGTFLKVANDGTFTVTTDASEAVGRAEGKVNSNNVIPFSFNADFYRTKSSGTTKVTSNNELRAFQNKVDSLTKEVEILKVQKNSNSNNELNKGAK